VRTTKWLWRTVAASAVLSTAICVFGFGYAVKQVLFPTSASVPDAAPIVQEKPDSWASKSQIRIVALGDSLTSGTGDLSGKGYVGQTKDKLEKQLGKPVFVFNNFAIPGYRTQDVLKDLDVKKDISTALSQADVIMLTIGGNDLFEGGQDIFTGGEGEGFNPKAAKERMPEALKRLDTILAYVAKMNKDARIFYVGLYHPFLDLDENREGALVIEQWNSAAFAMTNKYPNMTLVPTYDLFSLNLNKYLYSDHFHPNQEGYERIADRIAQILQ
jgi:lysophospholipase L1-like esterase